MCAKPKTCKMVITRRLLRLIGLGAIGWAMAEIVLFYLIGNAIGFLPATLAMMAKGFVGFVLLAANLRTILPRVALNGLGNGVAALSDAGFATLGAFLIFLPGVLTTLAGLALFSPSVRHGLVKWLKREKDRPGVDRDGILSLDATEWQEISPPKRRSPRKPREKQP